MAKATLTLSEMLDSTKPAEPKHLKRWSMPPILLRRGMARILQCRGGAKPGQRLP